MGEVTQNIDPIEPDDHLYYGSASFDRIFTDFDSSGEQARESIKIEVVGSVLRKSRKWKFLGTDKIPKFCMNVPPTPLRES